MALKLRLKTRRGLAALLAATATATALLTTVSTPVAQAADPAPPDHLVVAGVWGANSDTAQWTNDWIELYNPTGRDIPLGTVSNGAIASSAYSLCYRAVTAATQKCSSTVRLSGTVKAHHYFFVWYANAHSPADDGTYPAGFTPDLDVATKTAANGQQQGSNMGGCNTGGQVLLLDPTATDASSAPAFKGDLSSAAAKAAGVVDGVGWTNGGTNQPDAAEANGATPVTGLNSGTANGCVITRNFADGVPVDTDVNRTDFSVTSPASFTIHSQISDHVAVAPVKDTEISRNEAMAPIQVQGSKGTGALTYRATGLPDGVSIDPSSGVISGTPAATDALQDYPVELTVSDSTPTGAETATTSFTLTVSSTLRVDAISDVSVPKAAELTPIQVSAHGGDPAYSYAATGLPDGVGIDPSSGVISGTPTDAVGRYSVHVSVTDSGTGASAQSASVDFTLVEQPKATGPDQTDPLAGLRINEVKATGTPSDDWVELYDTGAALTDGSVDLVDSDGDTARLTGLDIDADGYTVVRGADLHAAGLDLAQTDSLYLAETDGTALDVTNWAAYPDTSWARYPDGTGDFAVSKQATQGTANAHPAALDSDHLVISEVNGDQSGVYDNNWFELYNPTDEPIDLGTLDTSASPATVTPNYYMCYSSTTAQSCSAPYRLYGTIAPHHHFLVSIYDAGSATLPSLPTGVTPDIDFGSTDPALNPSGQAAKNIGGYSTGGQWLLLDASIDTTGVYPTAANDTAANDSQHDAPGHLPWALPNGDLADPSVNPSPIVDAMGYSKNDGTANAAGTEGRTGNAVCAADGSNVASCVHSAPVLDAAHWDERVFKHDIPQDTNDNAADFIVSQRDPISQTSEHITIKPIGDTEISLNAAMSPIQVRATQVWSALAYSATGLPAGVTIDPHTGVISGTPDSADDLKDYAVTVTVGDGVAGDTATTTFTLTLSKVLRLDPIADVSANAGTPLTDIQAGAHGGTPPYAFAATGLPAGVTIDPHTGLISGTPTDTVGHYDVHVSVTDSGTGDAEASVSQDFALVELPSLTGPAAGDPLAGLTLNEIKATGTPNDDWVELYNTGAALTKASVSLTSGAGATYRVPAQDIAADGYVVIDGAALDAAGLDLAADDTLYLTETAGTLLDQTAWTSYEPTSWARTTDGTGDFDVAGWPTKGEANAGAPKIKPNDLLVSEVNYDTNSTDYYEYSEVTNTTDHPIDFSAYGLTVTKSGTAMTLHDSSDTSGSSPVVDPVIPAHGTQLLWWDENQYLGVKTTAQFLANYGLPADTSVVLVQGFSSLANSGGDHSYYLSVNQGSTPISQAWVDTPCAANTLNGTVVCTATNGNYAEHYVLPDDRTDPVAAVWYNSLHAGGDDMKYALKPKLSTPSTVDLEQVGFTRAVKIASVTGDAVTLHNTSEAAVDLSGYVLQKNSAGATYRLPAGTTVAAGTDLVVGTDDSGLSFGDRDYVTLLAPRGYAYTDGLGIADTTGPFLKSLPYDASSGSEPVIDPTTGLPLPPAGGLYRPAGVAALNGKVYVANTGDNVLAALANGSSTTVAGSLAGHGDVGDEGPAVDAQLYQPGGVVEDAAGNVYIADSGDNVIRKITPDGVIHRFAGTGSSGGDAEAVTAASTPLTVNLWHPDGVAVDSAGNVFIADTFDNRILEVTSAGALSVVAGTGKGGYTGDGSAATTARLSLPAGVAVDAKDDVYIADSANNVVRRVDATSGVITTVAGDYAADQAGNDCLGAYSGDGGPATSAQLNDPQGVALDTAGDLFVADTFNNAIREVTPDGTISTVVNVGGLAGAGNTSPVSSGSLPAGTHLNTPYAVAVDPVTNNVYVADTKNNAIAEVLNMAHGGDAAGPIEPADQVAVTGSGTAATACAVATNGAVASQAAPTIGGTPAVGSVLTAKPGTWSTTPDSFTFQWLRNGVPIAGATKATYTVTTADAGHALSVSVTAVKEDFASTSATSAAVMVAAAPGGGGGKPSGGTSATKPSPALQHAKAVLAHHLAALKKDQKAKKKAQKKAHAKHASRHAKAKAKKKVAHLKKKIKRLKKAVKADAQAVRSAS